MNGERHHVLGWTLVTLGLAWLIAVPLGLGTTLVGAHSDPEVRALHIALLYLPGLMTVSVGALFLARPLWSAMPPWRPGRLVHGLNRRSEEPLEPEPARSPIIVQPELPTAPLAELSAPTTQVSPSSHAQAGTASPVLVTLVNLVTLGPGRSPAYAAFGFAWKSPLPGSRPGFTALPPASRLVVGRDPRADVVIGLAETSWHHLELEVTEGGVVVTDLGSTNGTKLETRTGPVPLAPNTPTPLSPGDTLHLAEPVAISLTLEALR